MFLFKTKNNKELQKLLPNVMNLDSEFYIIIYQGVKIGFFELQPITRVCNNLHMHIITEYQRQGLGLKALLSLLNYLKGTKIKTLIATIPESNSSILSLVKKVKAKYCGIIENAIIENNTLENLLIFQLEVT